MKLILANYSPVQVEKVRQLLADGGIARVDRTTFTVVASDGVHRYEVSTAHASCTCKAGEHGRRCYHVAAAQLAVA
ncbi:SWIM zinc finger family protein [Amycolatopsis sp. FBCC-B4732]|uniref:SWIM zinc finger family protein n=1 Tax=Amycolatopsis sp. FBCC-B4732 TaxID=3079339 RepID=UPI001FF3058D|nr:SWIM zinc finger family protein [Amycolatopsis sp. FBCC-B4732]UOX85309.1 SWIM zinc finger family protein [Amycolatopsis sp. FBCC-B4732]